MNWLKSLISIGAIGIIILRLVFPQLNIDSIALGLIIVAILPWLSSIIESAELPGGWKIKFRDIKKAADTVEELEHELKDQSEESKEFKSSPHLEFFDEDPNLAMVALRIEIEKRVRELIKKHKLPEEKSLKRMLDNLKKTNVLESSIISGLNDLIAVGNRAAHGAKVGEDVAEWAIKYSDRYLYFLNRKIDQIS